MAMRQREIRSPALLPTPGNQVIGFQDLGTEFHLPKMDFSSMTYLLISKIS